MANGPLVFVLSWKLFLTFHVFFFFFFFFFFDREGVGEGFTNLHKCAVLEEAVLPNASDMLLPCK